MAIPRFTTSMARITLGPFLQRYLSSHSNSQSSRATHALDPEASVLSVFELPHPSLAIDLAPISHAIDELLSPLDRLQRYSPSTATLVSDDAFLSRALSMHRPSLPFPLATTQPIPLTHPLLPSHPPFSFSTPFSGHHLGARAAASTPHLRGPFLSAHLRAALSPESATGVVLDMGRPTAVSATSNTAGIRPTRPTRPGGSVRRA